MIKSIFSSRLKKNIITVASGSAIAQLITLLSAPLITRLYGPSEYGIQSLFISSLNIFSIIGSLAFPMAITLPKSNRRAMVIAFISVLSSLIFALILYIFFFAIAHSGYSTFLDDLSLGYAYILPLAMMVVVVGMALNQWLIRFGEYKLSSFNTIISSFTSASIKILASPFNSSALILILSNIFASVFGLAVISYLFFKKRGGHGFRFFANKQRFFWGTIKKHIDFPMYRAPQNIINAFSLALPIFFITQYFGVEAAGYYSLAWSVLGLPGGLIGNSFFSVYYPRINKAITNNEDVCNLLRNGFRGLFYVGLVPFGVIALVAPFIFGYVFGNEWRISGSYVQILAPFVFSQFVNKAALAIVPGLKIQRELLFFELISTVLKVIVLWFFSLHSPSQLNAIFYYSLTGSSLYIFFSIFVFLKAKDKFGGYYER